MSTASGEVSDPTLYSEVLVRNDHADPVPAFGVMRILGVVAEDSGDDDSDLVVSISQPDRDDDNSRLLFNGETPILSGEVGQASPSLPAAVGYDSFGSPLAVGDIVGTANGSWFMRRTRCGYVVVSLGQNATVAAVERMATQYLALLQVTSNISVVSNAGIGGQNIWLYPGVERKLDTAQNAWSNAGNISIFEPSNATLSNGTYHMGLRVGFKDHPVFAVVLGNGTGNISINGTDELAYTSNTNSQAPYFREADPLFGGNSTLFNNTLTNGTPIWQSRIRPRYNTQVSRGNWTGGSSINDTRPVYYSLPHPGLGVYASNELIMLDADDASDLDVINSITSSGNISEDGLTISLSVPIPNTVQNTTVVLGGTAFAIDNFGFYQTVPGDNMTMLSQNIYGQPVVFLVEQGKYAGSNWLATWTGEDDGVNPPLINVHFFRLVGVPNITGNNQTRYQVGELFLFDDDVPADVDALNAWLSLGGSTTPYVPRNNMNATTVHEILTTLITAFGS